MTAGLPLEAVRVRLGVRALFAPIDTVVAPGQVLVVMDATGSGKRSLLAWIAGLLEPPLRGEGRVRRDGRDITAQPVEQRRVGLLLAMASARPRDRCTR